VGVVGSSVLEGVAIETERSGFKGDARVLGLGVWVGGASEMEAANMRFAQAKLVLRGGWLGLGGSFPSACWHVVSAQLSWVLSCRHLYSKEALEVDMSPIVPLWEPGLQGWNPSLMFRGAMPYLFQSGT